MRTNIEIDDALLEEAMKATGLATKKAAVHEALSLLVKRYKARKSLSNLAGIGWEGDLDTMRKNFSSYE